MSSGQHEPSRQGQEGIRHSTKSLWVRLVVALLLLSAGAAAAASLWLNQLNFASWSEHLRAMRSPQPAKSEAAHPDWVAAAPGRVEPASGEIKVGPLELGRVAEIFVKVGDVVGQEHLLVRLEDGEARARLASAEAQVVSRQQDRDDATSTPAGGDRRRAEDKVAAAEGELATARHLLDRLSGRGGGNQVLPAQLAKARAAVAQAQDQLKQEWANLERVKAVNSEAVSRLDNALTIARADLTMARAMLEKTRIRAPISGTVLQLPVHVGETVAPLPERPLAVLGDLSRLRVRGDMDERNAEKVHVGQMARIRSEAFPDRDFAGKVTAIAPALGPARSSAPGPRHQNDAAVLDVSIELSNDTPLLPGMQVDVLFLASKPEP